MHYHYLPLRVFEKEDLQQHPDSLQTRAIHEVWKILLNDEFLDVYRNGIMIKCFDGKLHRLFPRIFTYSADYPEKYVQVHM